MLKVLLSLSPVFVLDLSAALADIVHHNASSPFTAFLINDAVLSTLLAVCLAKSNLEGCPFSQ